jgi:hypothetical protein
VIDRCPNHPWIALVSCPLLARVAAGVAEQARVRDASDLRTRKGRRDDRASSLLATDYSVMSVISMPRARCSLATSVAMQK